MTMIRKKEGDKMSRVLKNGDNQITEGYSNTHEAVDLVRYKNKTDFIVAHSNGKVVFVQTGFKNEKGSTGNRSYGNCVKIEHKDGYTTLYAHLSEVYVKKGQIVKQGQVIGKMGDSGNAYGVHLHFELRKEGKRINPTPYLNADLPSSSISCTYRVWDNKQQEWLPKVENVTTYAGNFGHSIGGFQMITEGGGVTKIKAHVLGEGWLKEVVDGAFKDGNNHYAGIKGKAMDGIAIWSQYGDATYRVHIKNGRWLPWISGKYDIKNSNGYAGILGQEMDAIQVYIK